MVKAKVKGRGGGGAAGKAASADSYRRQLTRVIANLSDEALLRICAEAQNPAFVSPGPPPGGNPGLSYRSALPFDIHKSADSTPFLHRSRVRSGETDSGFESYMNAVELSEYESAIADKALMAGLRLSFKCGPEYAPDIACAFAQRVPSRTLVFYDDQERRLIFRHENEEAIQDKQESEEK